MGLRLVGTMAFVIFFANSLHAAVCSSTQVNSVKKVITAAHFQMLTAKTAKEKRQFANIIYNSMGDCGLGYQDVGLKEDYLRSAQCSPVDLRKQMGPIRNQDGVGWCYAFAAADMLTFKNGGKPISASDLATQYIVRDKGQGKTVKTWLSSDQVKGGFLGATLEMAADVGVCREHVVPSELNSGPQIKEAYQALYNGAYYFKNTMEPSRQCYETALRYKKFFPRSSIQEIYGLMFTEPPWQVVQTLQQRNCPLREKSPVSRVSIGEVKGGITYVKEVLEQELDQGEPVGIAYNVTLITGADIRRNGNNMAHASTVVGRKYVPGKGCQYLIRNQWGRSCDGYKKDLKCEAGNIWVNEQDLLFNTQSAHYFK